MKAAQAANLQESLSSTLAYKCQMLGNRAKGASNISICPTMTRAYGAPRVKKNSVSGRKFFDCVSLGFSRHRHHECPLREPHNLAAADGI